MPHGSLCCPTIRHHVGAHRPPITTMMTPRTTRQETGKGAEDDGYNGDYGDINGNHSDVTAEDSGGGDGDDERHASIRPFKLEPMSGTALYELETRRWQEEEEEQQQQQQGTGKMRRRPPPLRLGCTELDEYVLLGDGFERGAVFGISSEDVEVGMTVS